MEVLITEDAKQLLDSNQQLLLYYDTEGCGCGVSGLPSLRYVTDLKKTYEKVANETYEVYIETDQKVFFTEQLKITANKQMLRISSKEGILNPFISQQSLEEPIRA